MPEVKYKTIINPFSGELIKVPDAISILDETEKEIAFVRNITIPKGEISYTKKVDNYEGVLQYFYIFPITETQDPTFGMGYALKDLQGINIIPEEKVERSPLWDASKLNLGYFGKSIVNYKYPNLGKRSINLVFTLNKILPMDLDFKVEFKTKYVQKENR